MALDNFRFVASIIAKVVYYRWASSVFLSLLEPIKNYNSNLCTFQVLIHPLMLRFTHFGPK